jgi:hypothetical protein
MKNYRNYSQFVRFLKQKLPARYPVSVRRVSVPKDEFGDCVLYNRKFTIRIDRCLPEWLALEVLIHEFAHSLSNWSDKEPHTDEWGVAYSKIYRLFLEFKDSIHKTKRAAKIFRYFQ